MTDNTSGGTQTTPPGSSSATTPQPGAEGSTTAPGTKETQALFDPTLTGDKKPEGEAKPGETKPGEQKPAEPTIDEMKKALTDKGENLDGKSDDDIKKMHADAKAKEAAPTFKIDDIKTPDDMPIPDDLKGELAAIATEEKLTSKQVQRFADIGVKMNQKNLEFWDQTKKQWREQSEKDPEIGGQKFEENVRLANKMVREFAGSKENLEELQDDLILLGLGQKRSFIKLLVNMGKHFGNAGLPGGGQQGDSGRKPAEQIFYPNMA